MSDKKKVDRIVNVCNKIIGEQQESLNVVYERKCLQKGKAIMSDSKQALVDFFEVLPSGRKIRESHHLDKEKFYAPSF